MFLSFDVGPAHDECPLLQRSFDDSIIFENCLECAALCSMIKFHLGKPVCIERRGTEFAGRFEEFILWHEEEFRFRVNEASDQPRASDSIHLGKPANRIRVRELHVQNEVVRRCRFSHDTSWSTAAGR